MSCHVDEEPGASIISAVRFFRLLRGSSGCFLKIKRNKKREKEKGREKVRYCI
jgi:hypothetical protein